MKVVLVLLVVVAAACATSIPESKLNKLGPLLYKTGRLQHRDAAKFALLKLAYSIKLLKEVKAPAANMNLYVDHLFADVDQWIIENGWEPFPIPDMDEVISDGLIDGTLSLRNGLLYGMKTLHRNGDALMYYGNKLINLHIPISFYALEVLADYEAHLLVTIDGNLIATIENLLIMIDITLDLTNYEIMMNTFEFVDSGSIDIEFHGSVWVDWLINIISDLLTWMLHDMVLGMVEGMMKPQLETMIGDLNLAIKNLLDGNWTPGAPELRYVH